MPQARKNPLFINFIANPLLKNLETALVSISDIDHDPGPQFLLH